MNGSRSCQNANTAAPPSRYGPSASAAVQRPPRGPQRPAQVSPQHGNVPAAATRGWRSHAFQHGLRQSRTSGTVSGMGGKPTPPGAAAPSCRGTPSAQARHENRSACARHACPVPAQRPQRRCAQVPVQRPHARLRPHPARQPGPVTGNAATGVPHARLSSSTSPNVSVSDGNTNTSDARICTSASAWPVPRPQEHRLRELLAPAPEAAARRPPPPWCRAGRATGTPAGSFPPPPAPRTGTPDEGHGRIRRSARPELLQVHPPRPGAQVAEAPPVQLPPQAGRRHHGARCPALWNHRSHSITPALSGKPRAGVQVLREPRVERRGELASPWRNRPSPRRHAQRTLGCDVQRIGPERLDQRRATCRPGSQCQPDAAVGGQRDRGEPAPAPPRPRRAPWPPVRLAARTRSAPRRSPAGAKRPRR